MGGEVIRQYVREAPVDQLHLYDPIQEVSEAGRDVRILQRRLGQIGVHRDLVYECLGEQLLAAVVHIRRKESQVIPANLVLLAAAAFVAWGRFGPYAF